MRTRSAAAVAAIGCACAAACGRVGFDARDGATGADDANGGDGGCALGPWSAPDLVTEFAGFENEYDPAQRGDRLQIWIVRPTFDEIHTASRSTVDEPYGPLSPEPFNGAAGDQDPTPSADGLRILWSSDRDGTYRIYEASRTSTTQAFGPAALAEGLETRVSNSMDLTPDGLTLYFNLINDINRVTRVDRDAPFSAPTPVGVAAMFPTVSSDEREIYYTSGSVVVMRSRATPEVPFGPETAIPGMPSPSGDPDLSADDRELLVNSDTDLYRLTRSCQ